MERKARIITIASGKGGVGKTSIALNLALALTSQGRKVCLMDADLGMANVDVLLGLSPPYSLIDFLEERCSLNDLMIEGPRSLRIIPAGSAIGQLLDTRENGKKRLSELLKSLEDFQEIVIDSAAGLSEQILHLLESASIPVLILVPEPTSLTDAYSVLKTLHIKGNRNPFYMLINRVQSSQHAEKVFGKFQKRSTNTSLFPLRCSGMS